MPGQRDAHAGCVGEFLVENDLFDFLLLSLPDNDTYSHRLGPEAQPTSIAEADRALGRLMDAGGGVEAFLEEHAVIVMADHSQNAIDSSVNLTQVLESWRVLLPADLAPEEADVAVCPGGRSAQVYVLEEERRESLTPALAEDLREVVGVDLVARRGKDEGIVWSRRGELRFAPGDDLVDARGEGWSVEGPLETLGLEVKDGVLRSEDYPDALSRLWSALDCPRSGDVLLSAAPGVEFVDWGGSDHVGGGSHGSLHRCDSLGVLLMCGIGDADARDQWAIRDVAPMVLDHFGVGFE